MCKCTRRIKLGLKHNDLAFTTIDHLDIEEDGYVPHIGILGGDYTNLTICLDCGLIQDWEPITDEQIKEALDIEEEESNCAESDVISLTKLNTTLAEIEKSRLAVVLRDCFGSGWRANAEAKELVIEGEKVESGDLLAGIKLLN